MTCKPLFTSAAALAALLVACLGAAAQGFPMPPGSIPGGQQQLCARLESQLVAVDRGASEPARSAQADRYEDAIRRQQGELDRTIVRSRRLGCERIGLFSLFTQQPAECGPLTKQIQELHGSIDRLMMQMQRAQGGTVDREGQRRALLIALADNDCGPQYRAVNVNRSRGLFESLFAPGTIATPGPGPSDLPQSSTFRTLCVRTCDGYYWPISFSTVPGRFAEDERACRRMCPAAPVSLYAHRNPGEEVAQAVSLAGQSYADLPAAFAYRKQYNSACSCKRVGETWAHALQHLDDTIERGDIVVTEERAKQLSKPREQRPQPRRGRDGKQGQSEREAGPALRGDVTSDAAKDSKVRSVGPTFLPAR